MSIFKELATLEERIEKDSKRKDEILSEISSLINKGKEVAGNWYVKDAGGNRYIKMSLVQDYRWRAIW